MEFNISIGDLQKALKVISAVAKPNADDASGQVMMGASDDGTMVFVGYSENLSVTHKVEDCDVKSSGKVCVKFSKFMPFINSFSAWDGNSGVKEVCVKKLKNNISINLVNIFDNAKKIKNKLALKMFPPQKFFIPEPFKEVTFEMHAAVLKLAISKVVYAIDSKASQSFIQGMNIAFDDDNVFFAGTNALTLSEYKTKNTGNLKEGSFIVPYVFLTALRKITDSSKKVYFEIDNNNIRAVTEQTTLHSSLIIDTSYPDYSGMFECYEHQVVLDKDIILSSFIPYINVLNDEDNKRLTIEFKDGKLSMLSDFSESTYEGDIGFDGHFIIDINGSFLAQTLNAINDDIIEMKFSDQDGYLIFDSGTFHDQKALITNIKRR